MSEDSITRREFRFSPLLLVLALGLAAPAVAQDAGSEGGRTDEAPPTVGTRVGEGVGREQMWPAPTEEDWAKPVLITFQRTWEDALAVAEEENKAILVCVNMDGEIASEHYAGIRYRQPEASALYEPYVNVIASVYRHSPRDFDENGERILCPRFGSVTCGEHISIEPVLFEKFLKPDRVAPRHVMVELDKEKGETESYDTSPAARPSRVSSSVATVPSSTAS
ncbi:MAG: hypothetical protein ACYTDX_11740 [Planctomycetota bacterium]